MNAIRRLAGAGFVLVLVACDSKVQPAAEREPEAVPSQAGSPPPEPASSPKSERAVLIDSLQSRGQIFFPGSYAKGSIPAGEYAFLASDQGGYFEEGLSGQIFDNENFASFGYVYVHGEGNITTKGALLTPQALVELKVPGALALYEFGAKQGPYRLPGFYKVGADIPGGSYIVQSIGQGYYEIDSGPIGNGNTLENDNFSGTKLISVRDGQYVKLSNAKFVTPNVTSPQPMASSSAPQSASAGSSQASNADDFVR